MDIASKITQIIEPSLTSMGYSLVIVRMADGKRKTLTIMAERLDGKGMSFDDCVDISRMVSALLEVDDPITSAYNLEVSSPGLDRPLTKLADFTRFAGMKAKVESMLPIDGRKRFRGVIKGVKAEEITMAMPEGFEVKVPFSYIRTAKLVPADKVIEVPEQKKKKKKG